MPKKPQARKSEQRELEEFAEKYETYAAIYGDPLEAVFEILADKEQSSETRLRAAETLMSYRFPKLKSLENKAGDTGTPLQFTINLMQPPAPAPVIDITPTMLKLEPKKP